MGSAKTETTRRRGHGKAPVAYLRAVRPYENQELRLDWRQLGRRQPPMWPGSVYLWRSEDRARENQRLHEHCTAAERESLLFIGTNTCGIVFALDRRGVVYIFDEIEVGGEGTGVELASSFAKLLSAAHVDESATERRARLTRYWRRAPSMWKRLEAVVAKTSPPTGDLFLSDLCDVREWAEELGKKAAFNDGLDRLRGRMSRPFKRWVQKSGCAFLFHPSD